jgi:hypothetical protein
MTLRSGDLSNLDATNWRVVKRMSPDAVNAAVGAVGGASSSESKQSKKTDSNGGKTRRSKRT